MRNSQSDVEISTTGAGLQWDDARIFLAIMRAGSLKGAGEHLGLSHSTVRRRISLLEKQFGVTLFVPTSSGVRPTDAARAALSAAENLEDAAGELEKRLAQDARELSGELIVTTIDPLVILIAEPLRHYAETYPGVSLVLDTCDRMVDLMRPEADVAIRLTNEPDPRLFGRKLATLPYAPFASAALSDTHGSKLECMPWLLFERRAGALGAERWYAEVSGGRAPIARVSSANALCQLAAAGVGGALLPIAIGRRLGLTQLAAAAAGLDHELWCLAHPDFKHSARIRSFFNTLKKIDA